MKIKNFKNYKFEIINVTKFEFDEHADEDICNLQIEIKAENLETKETKIFSFSNGGSGLNGFENNDFRLYDDACDNVCDDDDDLVDYLVDRLESQNVNDFNVTNYINF